MAQRDHWGSKTGFILAAAGSAVGLGNIWKFPYITGTNGGGWFVLIYLACILLVGLPILAAEIMIGRSAQKQPVVAFEVLQGKRTGWSIIGWLGLLAGFTIGSFYIVVAGWAMDYTAKHLVDFSKPIREVAVDKSLEYQAATPLVTMRESLVNTEATKLAKPLIAGIENQLPPSVWKINADFEDAMFDTASSNLSAEVRRRNLFIDSTIASAVTQAEKLEPDIAAAKAEARTQAEAKIAELSDDEVRIEATTVFRRQIIGDRMGATFGNLANDGYTSSFWALLFMGLVVSIVATGVGKGIEMACRILMPTLIGLILVMVIYAATMPGFWEGLSFVFKPDARQLKPAGVLEALGHAFFTLSLGMGAIITYGSYQKSKGRLFSEAAWIAGLDTVIALLACMMMFPIIFSFGQDPGAGPGLVFISMPLAFTEMGSGGIVLGAIFFFLLTLAAITSAISILEVCTSYVIDRYNWSRVKASLTFGGAISLIGVLVAFSSREDFVLESWTSGFGMSYFDTLDFLASNWMLPLGGLLVAIYTGWFLPKKLRDAEVAEEHPMLYAGWMFLLRFVAPGMVLLVLAQKIGLYDANELLHSMWH